LEIYYLFFFFSLGLQCKVVEKEEKKLKHVKQKGPFFLSFPTCLWLWFMKERRSEWVCLCIDVWYETVHLGFHGGADIVVLRRIWVFFIFSHHHSHSHTKSHLTFNIHIVFYFSFYRINHSSVFLCFTYFINFVFFIFLISLYYLLYLYLFFTVFY